MKVQKIWDGTDPGATPGRVFTASIGQELIINEGAFLDHIRLGVKGAVSTAAVAIETFAGVLSEYTLRVGAETRILANLQTLCALMVFFYSQIPAIGENTDGTGNNFIAGVKVPIQQAAVSEKPFTHSATRTAIDNIGTETLSITGYWLDAAGEKKPIHAVRITRTTGGSTGYEEVTARIAPVGRLIGILLEQENGFADGNIDVSVQRLRIKANGKFHSQFNALGDFTPVYELDFVTPSPLPDLLRPFTILDLRPEGIDAKGQELTLDLDVEDTSDAISITPVLEIEE